MERITCSGHTVEIQIINNKSSGSYKEIVKGTCKAKYQLVPPNVHCHNSAELAIFTFKAHFLSILAGVDPTFLRHIWYKILPQMDLTINLLRQYMLNHQILVWGYFNGPFSSKATPIVPIVFRVIIHNKPGVLTSLTSNIIGFLASSTRPPMLAPPQTWLSFSTPISPNFQSLRKIGSPMHHNSSSVTSPMPQKSFLTPNSNPSTTSARSLGSGVQGCPKQRNHSQIPALTPPPISSCFPHPMPDWFHLQGKPLSSRIPPSLNMW